MKVLLIFLLLLPFGLASGQRIGEMAPEKPPEVFPPNSWGVDLMFGEGGFGLGTFYRKAFTQVVSGFVDFSISELKDAREVQYIDYFGNTFTPNKVNRSFLFPFNVGAHFRLFSEALTDNLRPYISVGVGPTVIVTTPYDQEFFTAFKYAKAHYAAGGYIGLGANFGLSKTNLVGLNVRYLYARVFGKGIENLTNQFRTDVGQLYITLNIGIMY